MISLLMVFAPLLLLAQEPSIVAPGAKLERLFDDGFFTEGPAPAPDGSVYFSDIRFGVKASDIRRVTWAPGRRGGRRVRRVGHVPGLRR